MDFKKVKVAFVHDWLNGMRGGEKVLEYLLSLFPDADIFTLHHDLTKISDKIKSHKIYSSFIQKLPFKKKLYRWYLPFFPAAIKRFNLNNYEIVISTSHCAAKNIQLNSNIPHICYCFSPMRYIWALNQDYFGNGLLKKILMKPIIGYLKNWDYEGARRVTKFIAISNTIKDRINKSYKRDSTIIFPPTEIKFSPNLNKKEYFLVLSALTPYKKIDIAIKAANKINEELIVAGDGPLINDLKTIAGKKIKFTGWISDNEKIELLKNAKALIFPGFEDFGIVPLEAMSYCTPVIAYEKGGVSETVIHKKTGLLFKSQNEDEIVKCMEDINSIKWDINDFEEATKDFTVEIFLDKIKNEISPYIK